MSDHALFIVTPLASLVVLIARAAFLLIHDETGTSPPRPGPPPRSPGWTRGALLLATALLGVAVGHVAMIAWPGALVALSRNMRRLLTIECLLLMFGAVALAGVGRAVWRSTGQQGRGGSRGATAFLGVLMVTIASGLGITVFHRWALV